ncbi:MAG: endonuclease V [Oxalobacteraceae bacterium]|nr:MAG: endonuclease V [Oxalobacteraceae bacterium]
MTRINVIPVQELSRQHLIAEYRELPRVFGLVKKAIDRGEIPDVKAVPMYTLGTGHVRFFYPLLGYLADRQAKIVAEMLARGYSPSHVTSLREEHADIPEPWWGSWEPCEIAEAINRARIAERS